MSRLLPSLFIQCLLLFTIGVTSRRHVLNLKNDPRHAVLCSHFGYFEGGRFSVSMKQLDANLEDVLFSLDRDGGDDVTSLLGSRDSFCLRGEHSRYLVLSFDQINKFLVVKNYDGRLQNLVFEVGAPDIDSEEEKSDKGKKGKPAEVPSTLEGRVQSALMSQRLISAEDTVVSKQLVQMIESSPNIELRSQPTEQHVVLKVLHQLAEFHYPSAQTKREAKQTVRHDAKAKTSPNIEEKVTTKANSVEPAVTEPPSENVHEEASSDKVSDVLRALYQTVTPSGSVRSIPYNVEQGTIKVKFTVLFPNATEEGLYSFYFHHCPTSKQRKYANLTISMVERNRESYLSAGQQPLPTFYFVMCLIYLTASLIWFSYLRLSKHMKYRIHYLMFAVVLIKAISLAFHGINYYVIGKHGVHEEGWAVMYYITHIFRGALLFITILLIGAGWAFIKHMLTPRERNVFLIVIPLQILANVATVVIEESETGMERYAIWKDIFIFVDLACCGAILFPVVWSIRHLQAASQTDGKAAMNLRNLRLFRHFYILVICYVYFTRVIAYLLSITMSYSLIWVVELFKETVTFLFFVSVGYKFRPVDNNPYLSVPSDDDEEELLMERMQLEDVWAQSGVTDGVVKLNRGADQVPKRNAGGRTSTFHGQPETDLPPGSNVVDDV